MGRAELSGRGARILPASSSLLWLHLHGVFLSSLSLLCKGVKKTMTSSPPTQEKETLVPSSGFGEGSLLETSVAGADGYTRVEALVGSLTQWA